MKIKYLFFLAILTASALNAQEPTKLTPKKAKAYNAELANYDKTLTTIEGLINKKEVNKKSLQREIKKLEKQEKALMQFKDGKSIFDRMLYKETFQITVKDPESVEHTELIILGVLPFQLQNIVEGKYRKKRDDWTGPASLTKEDIANNVQYTKKAVALKQKELKKEYNL